MRTPNALSRFCLAAWVALHAGAAGPNTAPVWTTYETGVGGNKQIALADGVVVQLNTNSKLRTLNTGAGCGVTVDRGEAFFRVGRHPLRVNVDILSVSGADTSFSIHDYGGGNVDIMALDGRAQIDVEPDKPSGWLPSARRVLRTVSAGQILMVRAGKVSLHTVGRSSIERKLMWRYGMLEFVNETIENIVAEFNRYGRIRLVVDDDSVRHLRVGGRFSVFDPDTFVVTASRVFELRMQEDQTASGVVVRLGRMSRAARASPSPTH